MTDSQLYPLNLYLINNVKVIVFFLGGKGFNLTFSTVLLKQEIRKSNFVIENIYN